MREKASLPDRMNVAKMGFSTTIPERIALNPKATRAIDRSGQEAGACDQYPPPPYPPPP
jgi:hypothetical protein